MPFYEYKCGHCETVHEELVRSDTKIVCPKCNKTTKQKKLVSAPGVFIGLPFGNTKKR